MGLSVRSLSSCLTNIHLSLIRTSDKAEAQAWGGHEGQRELDDETNAQNDADREATASGVATPADPNAPSTPAPVEEDDKTQSYSEYLAAQVAATGESLAEKLGLSTARRQANEGADDSQWKNAKAFAKEEEDNDFFTGEAKVSQSIVMHYSALGSQFFSGEEGQEEQPEGEDLHRN